MKISGKVASLDLKVQRGEQSWNYIYVALGFVLAIEGTLIQMITPIRWPYNVLFYSIACGSTVWLFLYNAWFQNKLIGFKQKYEEKFR